MKISLNYNQPEGSKNTNSELTSDYINFAINSVHKDGVEGQLKRVVGRIQRKLDQAIEDKEDEVQLEEAEKDLIQKCFEKVKVPPQLIKYWIVLEDEIEKLGKKD